jgi:hypothetical protein
MPFTVEQFFEVFARYNESMWPAPVVLNILALVAMVLAWRAKAGDGRWVAGILAGMWTWMALAYHVAFFTAVNPAAWLFAGAFLCAAVSFVWLGIVRERLQFSFRRDVFGWVGLGLIGYALVVYPWLGFELGHRFPANPTFGLPCPTTIFTIGLLLFATPPVPRLVFAVPVLWALVGSTAAWKLGVLEDLGLLLAAAAAGVALVVRPGSPKAPSRGSTTAGTLTP